MDLVASRMQYQKSLLTEHSNFDHIASRTLKVSSETVMRRSKRDRFAKPEMRWRKHATNY
jgi:hypothetical protein